MKPIHTIYNLLEINIKIPDQHKRFKYLKDVWGIDQNTIGEIENLAQSSVSRILNEAKIIIPEHEMQNIKKIQFLPNEIRYIQSLPRAIIKDAQVIAFVENILKVYPMHSFYATFDNDTNIRIAALASLGVQNKNLVELFNKSQPAVSMMVKRNQTKALRIERFNRYDFPSELVFKKEGVNTQSKITLAGGQG